VGVTKREFLLALSTEGKGSSKQLKAMFTGERKEQVIRFKILGPLAAERELSTLVNRKGERQIRGQKENENSQGGESIYGVGKSGSSTDGENLPKQDGSYIRRREPPKRRGKKFYQRESRGRPQRPR